MAHDARSGDAQHDDEPRPPARPPPYDESLTSRPGHDAPVHAPHAHHDIGAFVHEDAAASADAPPPAYSEFPGTISDENGQLGTNATVASDGRVNISISQKNPRFSQIIAPQLRRQLTAIEHEPAPPPPYIPESLGGAPGQQPPPPLNIVIQVVGSRGDVQPFVALGKVLKDTYRHRVRLATHATFKDFVTENGLEFFSIGGDPAELMAFMVKNPGLMPGFDTLRSGEVGRRRKGIAEILRGTWRSCIETGDGLGVDPLQQTIEEWMGVEDQLPDELKKPFVADAIIANPPSFGHLHCAEKLGIPLHMMFTMPWSPTQQFPHPLANIQSTNTDPTITNFMSYILVEMLTWQGLGDLINRFRKDVLALDPISMIWSPTMMGRLKIPHTYCWSPALIPKPKDWAPNISVAGFFFLSLAQNYTPAQDLADFLAAGDPPVYIGFGSIVVDDPNAMTNLIFEAVKATGRRALVSKGWGGLGGDALSVPEGVFMLGNVPHDWLFQHVAAVVHHGGAGTTAAGIAAGRPTVVVPFFGDQPFWGSMVSRAGAGPEPIPYKDLTVEKLAAAIQEALKPESLEKAAILSARISKEQGAHNGAQAFHQMLKYDDLRCAVVPERPAVWRVKRTEVRLSAEAATVLAQEGELCFSDLKLFRPREYMPDGGAIDPVTGVASAIFEVTGQMCMGVADLPIETLKLLHIHPDTSRKNKTTGKGKAKEHGEDGSGNTENPRLGTGSNSTSLTPAERTSPEVDSNRTSSGAHTALQPASPPPDPERVGFMAQAMTLSSEVSRSLSPSRERACSIGRRPSRGHSPSIATPEGHDRSESVWTDKSTFSDRLSNMNKDSIIGTGKGVSRIVGAGFKSPMDFTLGLAQGFHNTPRLYGGDVRQVDKVTDLQSGLRTAAKSFGFGLYDGLTGVVTDPIKGAKKEGGIGLVKGLGRGFVSLPFRIVGGAWGVPAYAMKGLYQEILKNKDSGVQNYIIAARISQGYDGAAQLSAAEKADIVNGWKNIRTTVKKKLKPGEEQLQAFQSYMSEKKTKREKKERWALFQRGQNTSSVHDGGLPVDSVTTTRGSVAGSPQGGTSENTHPIPQHHTIPAWRQAELRRANEDSLVLNADEESERRDLEAAIRASISESSRGNPEEDELIARAIRASMTELQREPERGETEEQALQRAMQASLDEAQKSGVSAEEQKLLEDTLRASMLETTRRRRQQHGTDSEWDSSDTEDDEEYQRMLEESKSLNEMHSQPVGHDAHLAGMAGAVAGGKGAGADADVSAGKDEEESFRQAIEESEKAAREHGESLQKQRTEEEVVMEYVKKQSLAEAQLRRRMEEGRDTGGESSGAGGSRAV